MDGRSADGALPVGRWAVRLDVAYIGPTGSVRHVPGWTIWRTWRTAANIPPTSNGGAWAGRSEWRVRRWRWPVAGAGIGAQWWVSCDGGGGLGGAAAQTPGVPWEPAVSVECSEALPRKRPSLLWRASSCDQRSEALPRKRPRALCAAVRAMSVGRWGGGQAARGHGVPKRSPVTGCVRRILHAGSRGVPKRSLVTGCVRHIAGPVSARPGVRRPALGRRQQAHGSASAEALRIAWRPACSAIARRRVRGGVEVRAVDIRGRQPAIRPTTVWFARPFHLGADATRVGMVG